MYILHQYLIVIIPVPMCPTSPSGAFTIKPPLHVNSEQTRLIYFLFALEQLNYSKGAFHFSQAALPLLLKSGDLEHPPTLIFTGIIYLTPS